MLPLLIGAAVVAGVGYLASSDDDDKNDDYEECRYCSNEVYSSGLCRRHYREEQEEKRQREAQREEERRIKSEINSFKENAKRQIKNRYGVDISYSNASISVSDKQNSGMMNLENNISDLKTKNKDIENIISSLQRAKNEI